MDEAADVLFGDEVREAVLERGLDFAHVFAQLRLYPVHAEMPEELRLVLGRHDLLAFEEAVLAQFPAAVLGELAHADVVLLGAGEVVKRRGELAVLDDAEVRLDAGGEDDGALGRPGADYVLDAGDLRERVDDRRAVVA